MKCGDGSVILCEYVVMQYTVVIVVHQCCIIAGIIITYVLNC